MDICRTTRRNIIEYIAEATVILGLLSVKEDIMCDTCRVLWNRFYCPTGMCVDTLLYFLVMLVGFMCVRAQVRIVRDISEKSND